MSAFPSTQDQQASSQYGTQTKPIDSNFGLGSQVFEQGQMGAPVAPGSSALAVIDTIVTRGRPLLIEGVVSGGGALSHLSLYFQATANAPFMLLASDTDFTSSTPTVPNQVIKAASNGAYTTASGSNFLIDLASFPCYAYQLKAQGSAAGTAVQCYYGVNPAAN